MHVTRRKLSEFPRSVPVFLGFFFSVQDFFKKLFVKYIDLPHIIAYMQLMEFALAANSGFGTECFIIQKV